MSEFQQKFYYIEGEKVSKEAYEAYMKEHPEIKEEYKSNYGTN